MLARTTRRSDQGGARGDVSTTPYYGSQDSSSPYSAASPSGLSAGDDMYLAAAWLHAGPATTGGVTVPSGWNPVGHYSDNQHQTQLGSEALAGRVFGAFCG